LGGALTKSGKSKLIDIIPAYGWGFGRMKIVGKNTNDIIDEDTNPFLDDNTFRYTNPALLFNLSLDLRINLKILSLTGTAGYNIDISNKNWKANNVRLDEGPTTSLNNLYYGFSIALIFSSY
jgi:hypothetical protein